MQGGLAAVFEAYGWPVTLTDEEILERLVALNHERAEEEQRGLIRWLRPEFQNPQGEQAATQAALPGTELETETQPAKGKKAAKTTKLAWPKDLPGRLTAARDLLAELGEASGADFPTRFKGVAANDAQKILESLAAVGLALETTPPGATERRWRVLR